VCVCVCVCRKRERERERWLCTPSHPRYSWTRPAKSELVGAAQVKLKYLDEKTGVTKNVELEQSPSDLDMSLEHETLLAFVNDPEVSLSHTHTLPPQHPHLLSFSRSLSLACELRHSRVGSCSNDTALARLNVRLHALTRCEQCTRWRR